MKYVIGSLIISFGLLFVIAVVLNAMGIKAPTDSPSDLGVAWLIAAVLVYPLARKIIR